jgi:hypothetical protein
MSESDFSDDEDLKPLMTPRERKRLKEVTTDQEFELLEKWTDEFESLLEVDTRSMTDAQRGVHLAHARNAREGLDEVIKIVEQRHLREGIEARILDFLQPPTFPN